MNTRTLNIELCDDMNFVHRDVEKLLSRFEEENRIDIKLTHSYSGSELTGKELSCDILLLDIDLGDMDGIEAAKQFLMKRDDFKIIMLTGAEHRYKDAFKIQAFRFVTKPVDYDELASALLDASKEVFSNKKLDIVIDGVHCEVNQNFITYLDVSNTYVNVYLKDGRHGTINVSMVALEEMLDSDQFIRINRNVTVNLMYVTGIKDYTLNMEDGSSFDISVRRKKEVKKAYVEYDLRCLKYE